MIDFLMISTKMLKNGCMQIYPKFIIKNSSDLMTRGGDFYAIWIEKRGLWSTNEQDAIDLIDAELSKYANEHKNEYMNGYQVLYLWDAETGMIDRWHKYCQKQTRENFKPLDTKLIFSNTEPKKEDYATKKLSYPIDGDCIDAYDKLISTLYEPEERMKLEWAIGSIFTGDSVDIQKFIVLYGPAGAGKSTILNIIQQLFKGYYSVFDAKALGSGSDQFALEAFKSNPLVAIQHDGDLSRIEDNTRLNSLVSHEEMTVNEKFKSTYTNRFRCFLFMGTNKPVRITDAKSGIIRRLIDVTPSGRKIPVGEYRTLVHQVQFELGAIAKHCMNVYLDNKHIYDDYIPISMIGATNDFYNFVEDSYSVFSKEDSTTLKAAWVMYKEYVDDARVPYPYTKRAFKEELKNYFKEFEDKIVVDGVVMVNYYKGFRTEKFEYAPIKANTSEKPKESWLKFDCTESIFDKEFSDCQAQYANDEGTPVKNWDSVKTKLKDLDTRKLHYMRLPDLTHICVDFDIPDENGNKCYEKNFEAASKFPPTYAELSKSGEGIHLHYIYSGDPNMLSRIYDEHIEVKVFTGKSSLRRMLTKCNDIPIATISSGLPVKEDPKKMLDFNKIQSEKGLRLMIKRNLNKEIHGYTKPSIEFIDKILNDAYESGLNYDVTDMRNAILAFASNSSHNAPYCIKIVNKMKFKSADISENFDINEAPIAFYDVEIFPNLFIVCYKFEGEENKPIRLINPTPQDIERLLKYRLIGFNCRDYDNHMIYARLMGYSNEELYRLSTRIIDKDKKESRNCKFGEAYNLSYTDIYDYAAKKQSLKKWEIEMGIHHLELGLPWDQPVPEELWDKVAEYCDWDVIATEKLHNHLKADFIARQILADIADGTVNDTTNTLTRKLIFGNISKSEAQKNLEWRDMSETNLDDEVPFDFDEYTRFNKKGQPIFPGYKYEFGKSTYRGEEVGEGGYVYAEPGIYGNVALLDIYSMHPHSAIAENIFGEFTKVFEELVESRGAVKHEDWEQLKVLLGGRLYKYVDRIKNGEFTSKDLSNALKIAINSVYGLTSAKFSNHFRDERNVDNIVAKRGALFMINLKHEVQKRGFKVAHIKTDSIKIPDATHDIIQFVMDYGKMYGYTFEHEATYERMCLVNNAVYIAKYDSGEWTATGTQFQVPYVFKTLFSKEELDFEDMCETKSTKVGSIYLDMNEGLPDVSTLEEVKQYRIKRPDWTMVGEDASKKADKLLYSYKDISDEDLNNEISKGHNLVFVGKVGQFTPIKPGYGAGELCRVDNGKIFAVTGTKGYRWLESEVVRRENLFDAVDRSYYNNLVDEAIKSISEYGDYEWFVSDDPYVSPPYDKQGRPIYLDCGTVASDTALLDLYPDPLPESFDVK